jgi:hypothetical protein
MLKFEGKFDEYAYRVANMELDDSVATLDEGQWITKNNGKIVVADGTKKAFLVIGSKRTGRDQIGGKPIKGISFLHGSFFGIKTDQFDDAGTYNEMTPLKVKAGGVLTPWVTGTDKVEQLEAYALGAPVGGVLAICSAR